MMSTETKTLRGREFVAMWFIAAAVAVPLLMWMFDEMQSLDVPQSQAFLDYNTVRVDEFQAATAKGAIGVVIMGDSRVRYATDLQEELNEQLTNEVGAEVVVLRLTNDWATYSDFAAFMPQILDAEPQLIVLQEELRIKNRGYEASEAIKRKYLWWKLIGRGVWDPGESSQVWYQEENTCEAIGVEDLDDRLDRLALWVDYDAASDSAMQVVKLTEQLANTDVAIRYLNVPISAEGAAILPGVTLTQGDEGLSPNFTTPEENYCDYVHMDPVARNVYNEWFVTKIADELATLEEQR